MATIKEKTKKLRQDVAPFAKSDMRKSVFQMINTIVPLIALWVAGYLLVDVSPWLTVGLSVISAGFVVRTFIIFHDCTHGSFFKSKKANDWVGFFTGVLTSFPYEKWKREHTIHHATSSNLDKRGIGDIDMMTVEEYMQASKGQRLWYRFYRNPFVMFGLGPLYMVLVLNRFNRKDAKKEGTFQHNFNEYCYCWTLCCINFLHGLASIFISSRRYIIYCGFFRNLVILYSAHLRRFIL